MTEKQGCGDEGETKEVREEKLGKTRRRVSVRRRGDPGKIQGRSIDPRGSVFRGVGGSIGKGTRRKGVGAGDNGYEGEGKRRTGRGSGARMRQGR